MKKKVVAIVTADVHLKHKPPICRWGEDNWYEAMTRPLLQLQHLADKHDAPILYAGDIFDRWNPPPELINFAIKYLPPGYAIPGQHDLPYHCYENIEKSAYWTLNKAKTIIDVHPKDFYGIDDGTDPPVIVRGFPWGFEPAEREHGEGEIAIALVHRMVWTDNKIPYKGVPKENHANVYRQKLKGFDFAIFGDNHTHFIHRGNEPKIYNCGSLMRNNADQINYKPQIGLIYNNKTIETVPVDISQDKFLVPAKKFIEESEIPELLELAKEFSKITKRTVSFMESLENLLKQHDLSDEVKQIIIQAMEVSKHAE